MQIFDDEAMDKQEKEWIAKMHREWSANREANEFVKERLNGDPVHDYLVEKGRL